MLLWLSKFALTYGFFSIETVYIGGLFYLNHARMWHLVQSYKLIFRSFCCQWEEKGYILKETKFRPFRTVVSNCLPLCQKFHFKGIFHLTSHQHPKGEVKLISESAEKDMISNNHLVYHWFLVIHLIALFLCIYTVLWRPFYGLLCMC